MMTGIDIFSMAMRRRDEVTHHFLWIEGSHEMTERKEEEAYV
jgi:hypothetical protein